MNIKTISQLPSADVNANGYMEMSIPQENGSRYVSRKILYQDMHDEILSTAMADVSSTYNLADDSGPINVSQLKNGIDDIANADFAFNGMKTFSEWQCISADFPQPDDTKKAYGANFEFIIPNIKKIREMIDDNAAFISTTDSEVAEGNPLPQHRSSDALDSVVESLEYSNTIGSGKFYFWHIDGQQTDSSKSVVDKASGSTDGYEEMRDNGNLVVWGWLAENTIPAPEPEQCWVALFAKLKCEGFNDTQMDVPVSVKPWIRGKNSSTIQYISFNIPVRKGLRLKIKTGFPVNDKNSGIQRPGSLTFLDGNIPNAFFGYIIK